MNELRGLQSYVLSRVMPARGFAYSNGNTTSVSVDAGTEFIKYLFEGIVVGEFKNITPDIENERSIIQKRGRYLINCTFSSYVDTTNVNLDSCVLVNGIEETGLHIKRYFIGVSYISSATISGTIDLDKDDIVEIGVKHDKAGSVDITTEYASLSIIKI